MGLRGLGSGSGLGGCRTSEAERDALSFRLSPLHLLRREKGTTDFTFIHSFFLVVVNGTVTGL